MCTLYTNLWQLIVHTHHYMMSIQIYKFQEVNPIMENLMCAIEYFTLCNLLTQSNNFQKAVELWLTKRRGAGDNPQQTINQALTMQLQVVDNDVSCMASISTSEIQPLEEKESMKDINLSIIAFRREIKKKMDEGTKNCIYSTHQTSCHLYLI